MKTKNSKAQLARNPGVGSSRIVRPTNEMKLKALSDIRAWTTEHSAPGPIYSDIVEERANSREEREQWRRAYDWVDNILVRAIKRIKLV
jgi:hypothetical protein